MNNWNEINESEILFSRVIKAGKRVYYLDVKRDRRSEYYISMTESKRVKEGTEMERPVFEKHKIFLYREDILKFMEAFEGCAQYIDQRRPVSEPVVRYRDEERPEEAPRQEPTAETMNAVTEIAEEQAEATPMTAPIDIDMTL